MIHDPVLAFAGLRRFAPVLRTPAKQHP